MGMQPNLLGGLFPPHTPDFLSLTFKCQKK